MTGGLGASPLYARGWGMPFSCATWEKTASVDHYSRCAIGFGVFPKRPTSLAVRTFLGSMIARANATPKYMICDKDSIFWCGEFKRWCRRKRIRPRYGAAGQHGSIAVIERFIRTMKDEATRRILVPQRRTNFRLELNHFFAWYNAHRPHPKWPLQAESSRFPCVGVIPARRDAGAGQQEHPLARIGRATPPRGGPSVPGPSL